MNARASIAPEIDGYELRAPIGRGSMGTVYAAVERATGRDVALKLLHADVVEHEMALERFRREVELVRRIGHGAIPEVYDAGQLPDGRLYLAMELLRGESLEEWWDTPGHSRLEALEPLAAAHAAGVVHRDLKPENVYVCFEGAPRVKLLDFGIARELGGSAKKKTATGVAVGTPVYMSPEQASKPSAAGPATDVWSFGVMVYEALCGELPFDGESPHAVLIAVCTEPAVALETRAPGVHPDLHAFVRRCLQKDVAERYPDGAAAREAFGALLARPEVRATLGGPAATPELRLGAPREERPSAPTRCGLRRVDGEPDATLDAQLAQPERRRSPALLVALLLLLAVVGGGVWMGLRGGEGARSEEEGASGPMASGPSEPAPMEDGEDEAPGTEEGPDPEPAERDPGVGPEPEVSAAENGAAENGASENGVPENRASENRVSESGASEEPGAAPEPAAFEEEPAGQSGSRSPGSSRARATQEPAPVEPPSTPEPAEPPDAPEPIEPPAPEPPPAEAPETPEPVEPPTEEPPARTAPTEPSRMEPSRTERAREAPPERRRRRRRPPPRRPEPEPERPGFVTF